MVIGMARRKVTVTVGEEQLAEMRRLVAEGRAGSVSGFVQRAIDLALDDLAGWEQTLGEALAATGGAVRADERRWADEVLGVAARSAR